MTRREAKKALNIDYGGVVVNNSRIVDKIYDAHEAEIKEIIESTECVETYGFEGRDTFSECGECAYCKAKNMIKDNVQ